MQFSADVAWGGGSRPSLWLGLFKAAVLPCWGCVVVAECVMSGFCRVWDLVRIALQRRSVVRWVCKTCLIGPRSLIVAPNPGEINGHQRGGQGDWVGGVERIRPVEGGVNVWAT